MLSSYGNRGIGIDPRKSWFRVRMAAMKSEPLFYVQRAEQVLEGDICGRDHGAYCAFSALKRSPYFGETVART
jgi:hypothetical protein